MNIALAPLVAFALSHSAPVERAVAAADVAEAIADADQIVRVHEAPGAIVFDLDRGGELFQLTVSLDDDGRVTASTVDWAGPTGPIAATAGAVVATDLARWNAVERIDLDADRRVVLRGGGRDLTLALIAP